MLTLNPQIVDPHKVVNLVVADRNKYRERPNDDEGHQSDGVVEGSFYPRSRGNVKQEIFNFIEESLRSSSTAEEYSHIIPKEEADEGEEG